MPKPPPAALGDAYPALRNFLKLTALTLDVPQVALTVQVGSRPYSTGALSYGPMTQAALRQMLQQPQPDLAPITETLSLGTIYRIEEATPSSAPSQTEPPAPAQAALMGRIHPPRTSYYLTLYIPGIVAESLSVSQVKTLAYLAQQLLMCLRAVPLPPDLVPPPLPSQLSSLENPDDPENFDNLADLVQPNQDFLSRVVSINPPRPVGDHQVYPRLPSMIDLVAQLQACLSYEQLGQLLGEYLPPFFPQQAGQLTLISGVPPQTLVLAHWGHDQRFKTLVQQCPLVDHPAPSPRLGLCTRCHPVPGEAPSPGVVCTVLGHSSQATCLLQVSHLDSGPSPLQNTLLQKLSEHMLYVMQRLLVLEDLQSQATHDPLTGLLNRRPMETVLQNLCQTGNRQQSVSLILIDIDHFKVINDTFGHLVGDQVLKDLSVLLRGHVRSQDIVCRYGGEEFCMVLFDTALDVAISRAEKIRRAVKYLTLTHEGTPIEPLTISLGVSCFPRHGQDPDQLLQRADQALYWAKAHGRDRTATADEAVTET
ncbi:GGDEF domain-containing protein [Leptolyngbya sp. BL0902]|uniref:GGDEF domain-containing protein n=1 Tax=Leptolyngbya sp. BL0902 TaxID=1115757 RepID=UPI0018E81353|nr:GGDEF domain-containing protein [Leptolyngbya sp. BL0902]QQE64903.1 GGDEF domain-containing protein [Leptolyngbya sp. BL0902]